MSPCLARMYLLFMLCGTSAFAQESIGPPPPNTRAVTPPGLPLPIDSDIVILLCLGLILGIYITYKRRTAAKS